MKKIPLTQNKFALVDDADYDWLNQFKWYARNEGQRYYACRSFRVDGHVHHIVMHRLILGLKEGDGKITDHIDGNGLNNSRSNLRICTSAENNFNQRPQAGKTSKYKGVHWDKIKGKMESKN